LHQIENLLLAVGKLGAFFHGAPLGVRTVAVILSR
jgi:hypothetical protein